MKHKEVVSVFLSLVIASFADVPADWEPRVQAGNMIYSPTDTVQDSFLLPVVANGYLGTVIGASSMYVGGVFNGNLPTHRADIPATSSISITNGATFAAAIDLEYAIYYRRSVIPKKPGIDVEQRWFAHRYEPHLLVHEMLVTNTNTESIQLDLSVNSTKSTDFDFQVVYNSNGITVSNGSTLIPEISNGQLIQVAVAATDVPAQLTIPPSGKFYYQFLTVIATSLDSSDPVAVVKALYSTYYNSSTLEQSHIAAWQTLWESGIEIEGDSYLAAAVNNSLYEILSNIRTDWPYSLSPGGISTNGYNGHTFWDAETWMYPTLLLFYPEIARGVLDYRYARISASETNAHAMGYEGAKYAWQCAFTGLETTLDPPNPEGHLEVHINGDVARAVAQYFFMTGDITWLNTTGFPILSGIAEYWVSRVQWNTSINQYVINGVQCPDEAAVNVNNSVFTNVVASLSLTYATQFATLLGISPNPSWLKIANNMKIPFDEQAQWHPEYDGYNGQTINQADVALLQYPLGYPMDRQVAVNDLLYYQNHTDRNGMFTGDCSYSIAWLRLGNAENAEYYFNNTLQHLKPPFMVFTERIVGGIPHFITGAGGFLQNIVFGYTGLQIENGNITVFPSILPYGNTTKITLRKFVYSGNFLTISFNDTHISFENGGSAQNPVPLVIIDQQGNSQQLEGILVYDIGKLSVMPKQQFKR